MIFNPVIQSSGGGQYVIGTIEKNCGFSTQTNNGIVSKEATPIYPEKPVETYQVLLGSIFVLDRTDSGVSGGLNIMPEVYPGVYVYEVTGDFEVHYNGVIIA